MSVPSFLTINMSASWEGEKQSSHVVTRYCNFKIIQIILEGNIDNDPNLNTIFLAVRMGNSQRKILRSSEISFVPTNKRQDEKYFINIDLNCNIVYSHSLKRDCNILQILVQRKKRYKNKTVLGYKSLGYCNIDLNQVLQRNFDNRFLDLYSDMKSFENRLVGRVEIQHLASVPYDKITKKKRKSSANIIMTESSFDDLEENQDPLSDDSESDDDHLSDVKSKINLINVVANRQKQLKQKFLGWVKKVKSLDMNEEFGTVVDRNDLLKKFDELTMSEVDEECLIFDEFSDENDIDLDFFNRPGHTCKQLKNFLYMNGRHETGSPTDSTLSLESTPRPVLRPYLGSRNNAYRNNITNSSEDTLSADAGARLLKRFFDSDQISLKNVHSGSLDNEFMKGLHDSKNSLGPKLGSRTSSKNEIGFNKISPILDDSLVPTSPKEVPAKQGVHFNSPARQPANPHLHENTSSDSCSDETKELSVLKPQTLISCSSPVPIVAQKLVKDLSGPLNRVKNAKKYRSLRGDKSATGHQNQPQPNPSQQQRDEVNVYPASPLTRFTRIPKLSFELNRDTVNNVNEFIDQADSIPDEIFIISDIEESGQKLLSLACAAGTNRENRLPYFSVGSIADAKYIVGHLVNRLQLTKLRTAFQPVKICILGNDLILHTILRAYVDQLSGKPSEFSAIFRFYLVPITFLESCGENFNLSASDESLEAIHTQLLQQDPFPSHLLSTPNAYYWSLVDRGETDSTALQYFHDLNAELNSMACHLCRVDPIYSMIFCDYLVPEAFRVRGQDLTAGRSAKVRNLSILDRIMLYLNHSKYLLNLTIGECLVGLGEKTINFTASAPATVPANPANTKNAGSSEATGNFTNSHVCVEKEGGDDMLVPFLLHVSLGCDPVSALLSNYLPKKDSDQETELTELATMKRLNMTNSSTSYVTTQTSHHSTLIQGLPIIDSTLDTTSCRSEDVKGLLYDLQLECILSVDQSNSKGGSMINGGAQNNPSVKRSVNKCCTRGLKIISGSLVNSLQHSLFYDGFVPNISPIITRHPLIQGTSSYSNNQILIVAMANKEKKQKISLLNKKSKDSSEYRHEFMTNINRIICSGRRHQTLSYSNSINLNPLNIVSSPTPSSNLEEVAHQGKTQTGKQDSDSPLNRSIITTPNNYLTINIDGVEWKNVKFFQIGPSWRTHVKQFPLSTFVQGVNFPVEISRRVKSPCGSQNLQATVHQNLHLPKKIHHDSTKIHHHQHMAN